MLAIRKYPLWSFSLFCIAMAATIPPVVTTMPTIAGKVWPVVTDTYIENVEVAEREKFSVIIRGTSKKRLNCSFEELRWYLGRRGDFPQTRVLVEFLESSKVRKNAPFKFGPWRIHVHWSDFTHRSHADVYHKCYMFGVIPYPWYTRTPFYG